MCTTFCTTFPRYLEAMHYLARHPHAMRVRMAPSCMAVSTLLLLAVAGVVSAQSPCLGSGPNLLYYSCLPYLTLASEPSPDPTCCSAVVSLTTDYGPGCLCDVIQFQLANPDSDSSQSIIPGRMNNLNGDCSAHADMTNCSGSSPPPAGGVTTPPALVTTPPGSGSTPPGVETPTLGGTSPPAKGSKASTSALVGGSVGGLSVFGVIVYVIIKCLQSSNFEIKCDLNAPCWCCQRRSEKPQPSLHPSYGGTDGVHHPASYPPPYPTPYRAPYPVHFGARA